MSLSSVSTSSSIEINYRKIRPLDLEGLAKQYEPMEDDITNQYNPFVVSEIQSFSPLYTDFFILNESNYNRVGLNHTYYLEGDSIKSDNVNDLQHNSYYVKCSPLLDPIHYLVGKYQHLNNLNTLPTITNQTECFAKITNKQNASYVDGFFSYLSSQLKHNHNMLNAIDFYGSHLAIQKVFKATITDDIEYLHQSNYFIEHLGKGVTVSCGSDNGNTFDDFTGIGSRANKKRLVLEEELDSSDFGIDVLELEPKPTEEEYSTLPDSAEEDANISCEYESKEKHKKDTEEDSSSDEEEGYSSNSSIKETDSKHSYSHSEEDENSEDESTDTTDYDEADVYAYIENFPANLIFLEKCDGTLDRLFMDQEIDEKTGASCLMQIVMSLIAFQKAFQFTHNDLHTNNIMYINTDIEFLYYKYNNQFYRVPTYGKIFKIIDFGRAIYRFKDQIYCSDSFAPKGDAYSQYNTEPYFNDKRPRIEPNPSFDLCRLGTSIYDFIIPYEDDSRDEFQETIYRWCLDDNGKNIMYRRDGAERYPGFKLYKMIARNVHAHTPQEQLKYPFFNQFLISPTDAAALDISIVRKHGLNIDMIQKE